MSPIIPKMVKITPKVLLTFMMFLFYILCKKVASAGNDAELDECHKQDTVSCRP